MFCFDGVDVSSVYTFNIDDFRTDGTSMIGNSTNSIEAKVLKV